MAMEFARFLLVFRAMTQVFLPRHKMNVLRSALGANISRVACGMAEHRPHQPLCLFERLHEGRGANRPPGMNRVPPFVIQCLNHEARIQAGEMLQVWFTLLSPREFYPEVLEVWRQLGRGLGRPENEFRLERVIACHPFSDERRVIANFSQEKHPDLSLEKFVFTEETVTQAELPEDELIINFVTPCRLEEKHQIIRRPTFKNIAMALRRRAHVLGNSWGDGCPIWAERDIIDAAEEVRVVRSDLEWQDWSRESGTQRKSVDMGGFTGTMTIRGNLKPLHALLSFGELFHVGGGLTSGNGQYAID